MNWDTIFTVGTHTDSNGNTRVWTEDDLDRLAANTKPGTPVVIRHPENESDVSNYGEIAVLRRVGGKLQQSTETRLKLLKRPFLKDCGLENQYRSIQAGWPYGIWGFWALAPYLFYANATKSYTLLSSIRARVICPT